MKECKKCDRTFDDSVTFCPFCGEKLGDEDSQVFNESHIEDAVLKNVQGPSEKETPLPPGKVSSFLLRRKLGIYLGLLIAILPFFITGFSFYFTWYILIAITILAVFAALGSEEKTEENLSMVNTCLVVIIIIAFIMYMWGPLNPNY